MSKAKITAIGTYAPSRRLTNADLEKIVDTSDEWIVQRTGMRERRIADEQQFTSDLCIEAVKDLKSRYEGTLDNVDMILVATTTSDYAFPSTACRVQEYFGWESTGALDINATCAGLTYGLHLANGLITSGLHQKILVIAGETLSKVTDYTDRTTCVLFGDAAGALLVERDEETPGFLASVQGTSGNGGTFCIVPDCGMNETGCSLPVPVKWSKTAVRCINGQQEPFRANLNAFYIKRV